MDVEAIRRAFAPCREQQVASGTGLLLACGAGA